MIKNEVDLSKIGCVNIMKYEKKQNTLLEHRDSIKSSLKRFSREAPSFDGSNY